MFKENRDEIFRAQHTKELRSCSAASRLLTPFYFRKLYTKVTGWEAKQDHRMDAERLAKSLSFQCQFAVVFIFRTACILSASYALNQVCRFSLFTASEFLAARAAARLTPCACTRPASARMATTRNPIPAKAQPGALRGAASRSARSSRRPIVIRGARQHNLKGIDLELPRNKIIVFTGPSGSGKSSLAFDTIYAEGQRRYVESLSAYARQFLERMDKPDVDLITGLAPAIAIEQKTTSKNPRSTIATQTEIYDHLRLLFARIGRTISPVSGEEVTRDAPRSVAERVHAIAEDRTRFHVCFPIPDHKKTSLEKELGTLRQRGFFRLLLLPSGKGKNAGNEERILDLNEEPPEKAAKYPRKRLLVLVDRLAVRHGDEDNLSRISDSAEQAFRESAGPLHRAYARGGNAAFQRIFRTRRDALRRTVPAPVLVQ